MLTIDANVWVSALDARDAFHEASVAFLRAVSRRRLALHAPAFLLLEVSCALARRTGSEVAAVSARKHLEAHPDLTVHVLDAECLESAHRLGPRQRLRGADALYAATAFLTGTRLVSWDSELVDRGGAVTPDSWVAENP